MYVKHIGGKEEDEILHQVGFFSFKKIDFLLHDFKIIRI